MLHDLDFLQPGRTFPPECEVDRLEEYRINEELRTGNAWGTLSSYRDRVDYLLANFDIPSGGHYLYRAEMFQDITQKYVELICHTPPTIDTESGSQDELTDMLKEINFFDRLMDSVEELHSVGDLVWKVYTDPTTGKNKFTIVPPDMWFPVCDKIDRKQIVAHVIAWAADVGDRSELHAQIHTDGKFENKIFEIPKVEKGATCKIKDGTATYNRYTIGKELSGTSADGFQTGTFQTGIDGFAVFHIPFKTRPLSVYGVSGYKPIESSVMEYLTRMTLKDVVLDKHAAPKMAGPMLHDNDGYGEGIGNYMEITGDQQMPQYLTWDASMVAVENTITALRNDIASLSGLGALLDTSVFGDSQGYDALLLKATPATMRSQGIANSMTATIQEMLAAVSTLGYTRVDKKDIAVRWHVGIPEPESQIATMARLHKESGLSQTWVNVHDYGMTEEEAEQEAERKQSESELPAFMSDYVPAPDTAEEGEA